jgi:UDPglucose 6-dehydrogenase
LSRPRYSIVGLGKLGASMAAAIAGRGFDVVGVDVDQRKVDAVNTGLAPIEETGLDELFPANRHRLSATTSYDTAVAESDLTFVVVPTPSDECGMFSLELVARSFSALGRALAKKDGYHCVVLTSTVLPGATRYGLLPILERESGRSGGEGFGLCYSPEFIALGSVVRDFLNPDFLLVGELDTRSGDALYAAYEAIVENGAPVRRMSLENAELTKIALNAFVTTKITFANMLGDLCARVPGGDVDVVTEALGLDERIGGRYLTGGLGYGGPCFPRDNLALSAFARAVGTLAPLSDTTDAYNRTIVPRLLDQLREVVSPGTRVAVLGLAYKPLSNVVEESQALALARRIAELGAVVTAYDPRAREGAAAELEPLVRVVDSLRACVADAETVLVTTPDPEFRSLEPADLALRGGGDVTVVDVWRVLADRFSDRAGIRYVAPGRGAPEDEQLAATLAALWASPQEEPEFEEIRTAAAPSS